MVALKMQSKSNRSIWCCCPEFKTSSIQMQFENCVQKTNTPIIRIANVYIYLSVFTLLRLVRWTQFRYENIILKRLSRYYENYMYRASPNVLHTSPIISIESRAIRAVQPIHCKMIACIDNRGKTKMTENHYIFLLDA